MWSSKPELPQSQKVVWRIENFSKLKNRQLHSDTFSFNGRKWRMVINPKDDPRSQTHLTVYLFPVDHTKSVFADYTLAIIHQKDDSRTVKREVVRHEFNKSQTSSGFCYGSILHLSELQSPANGYLLNDTCIVELTISKSKSIVEDYLDNGSPVDSMFFLALSCFLVSYVTCVSLVFIGSYKLPFYIDMILVASLTATFVSGVLKFLLPKDCVTRDQMVSSNRGVGQKKISVPLPAKGIELVSNTDQKKHGTECKNHKFVDEKTQGKEQVKVSETELVSNLIASPEVGLVEHPGAGQIFEGGIYNQHNQEVLDGDIYVEIGGFLVQKAYASLYKQIWLKYGHIASSNVLIASSELSYIIQIAAVDHIMYSLVDIMDSLKEMSCRELLKLSSKMTGFWESEIITAENLQFNIGWLRKHFDNVKQGFDAMQKLKTTLHEEVQPIKAATECENHKLVEEKTKGKEEAKVSETEPESNLVASPEVGLVKHLGAGQIFEGGMHNKYNQDQVLDGDIYEEIGGFHVQKPHASLYKQIWLKYGHIASSHVLTASSELSYVIQVAAVHNIMHSLMDMSRCRFVEVSSEMIVLWEGDIKTANNLQFNIEWLRKHFDTVKQGFDEMQKLKTTLHEEVQPIEAAKAQVTAAEDELKKVQAQLAMAKDELKEKISALPSRVSPITLSESEFEMYLEKGDSLVFDGVF
ncbi:hypothetical protein MKW92_041757 [Papaver armeniacum]|nr:hypothetical protein MKW92_041757 [Papaver armeniacum]